MAPVVDVVTLAILIGLLPLAVLAVLYTLDRDRDEALWWIAGAFAVSWLADVVADMLPIDDRWPVTRVYPVMQSTLIAAALALDRRRAVDVLIGLVSVAMIVIVWRGSQGPDVVVHSTASLAVIAIVWTRRELPFPLRASLFVYFGLGLGAWLVYAASPSVNAWYGYQLARLAGLLLFSWASIEAGPQLRVVRRAA